MRLLAILWINLFLVLRSQAQDTARIYLSGGQSIDEGMSIVNCANGDFCIAGTTSGDAPNAANIILDRIDSNFQCLWSRSIGGPSVDRAYSVIETAEGDLVVCGFTGDQNGNGYDGLVVKCNAMGEVQWSKNFGGADWDFLYKIKAHPMGGFVAVGKKYSESRGSSDAWILQLSEDGTMISERTFGASGTDGFTSLEYLPEWGYAAGGSRTLNEGSGPVARPWLMRISTELDSLDEFISPRLDGGEILDVKARHDSLLLGGYFENNAKKVPLFILMDTSLNVFWDADNALPHDYIYTSVLFSSLLLNTGVQSDYGGGMNDLLIEQRDVYGNWNSGVTFGGQKNETAGQMILDRNHEIIILGTSNSYDANENGQIYLIRWPRPVISSSYVLEVDSIVCDLITAVDEVADNSRFYFDNGFIHAIVDDHAFHQLDIFDSQGRLIRNEEFRNSMACSMAGFESGLYIAILDKSKQIKIASFR